MSVKLLVCFFPANKMQIISTPKNTVLGVKITLVEPENGHLEVIFTFKSQLTQNLLKVGILTQKWTEKCFKMFRS